jgi:hypothetical protein
MSDRFPGEIRIGGAVPKKSREEFCRELNLAGGAVGGFGSPTRKQFFRTWRDVTDNLGNDGLLRLSNDEAACGMFEELEEFLVRHGIAFDRRSDAKYGYDAESVSFRPGMKKPVVRFADQGGNPMVPLKDLTPIAKRLDRLATKPPRTVSGFATAVRNLNARLRKTLPPEIPPLTKLEIK